MFPATLAYNLSVGVVWIVALALARRSRAADAAGLAATFPLAAGGLAVTFGEGGFGVLRLLAWGLLLHGPLFLATGGWMLRRSRGAAIAAWLAALTLAAAAADAFLVEPHRIEVTTQRVSTAKLARPLRIVVVADLQTDRLGAYERAALARALSLRPDMILFAGDYVQIFDRPRRRAELARLRELLAELRFSAPLGVYAVRGNVDAGDWLDAFDGLPVTTFSQTATVELAEARITGLSLEQSFTTDTSLAAGDKFHLVLGHAPDFALGEVDADLLVAGHTHGGQVRLPGIGPLMTLSAVPRAWAAGRTQLAPEKTLIVSRGLGMERGYAPRLRFLCRPELVVIELVPAPR